MAIPVDDKRRRAAAERLGRLLERHPPEVAEAVVGALEGFDPVPSLDPDLWGEAPSEQEFAEASTRAYAHAAQARERAIEASLSLAGAAELLQIKPQAVQQRLAAGKLVGIKHAGRWWLPKWQFQLLNTPAFDRLPDLQEAFMGDAVALTLWVGRTNADLAGSAPLQAMLSGRAGEAIAVAEGELSAGW